MVNKARRDARVKPSVPRAGNAPSTQPSSPDVAEVFSSKKGSSNLTTSPPNTCVINSVIDNIKCVDFKVTMNVTAERVGNTLVIEWITIMEWWITYDYTSYCKPINCKGACFPSETEVLLGENYPPVRVVRTFTNQASSELARKYGVDMLNSYKGCANPSPPYGDGKQWSDKVKDMMDKPFEKHPLSDTHYDLVECRYNEGDAGHGPFGGPVGTGLKKPYPDGPLEPGDWFAPGGIEKGEMLGSKDWNHQFGGAEEGVPKEREHDPEGGKLDSDGMPTGSGFGPCQCIGTRDVTHIRYTDFDHTNQQADDPEDVLILELPGLVYIPRYFTHVNQVADEGI